MQIADCSCSGVATLAVRLATSSAVGLSNDAGLVWSFPLEYPESSLPSFSIDRTQVLTQILGQARVLDVRTGRLIFELSAAEVSPLRYGRFWAGQMSSGGSLAWTVVDASGGAEVGTAELSSYLIPLGLDQGSTARP